ncbi:MAG: hypothetical protein AUI14_10905 [Actinobacteria bacterium 13_2_20CM_2_71_6]|nr:MAG: hypothetical protein AUI14_10905 [Actinobacteria bacterium 13_2_20CM_2_71_6]
MFRRILVLAVAACAMLAVATAAGVASATTVAATTTTAAAKPIGPRQFFLGIVNGRVTNAAIQMACFGPGGPGRTGHPLAGQYVAATPVHPELIRPGYTGTAAKAIDVSIVLGTAPGKVTVVPVGTLTSYGTKLPIPTTLTLPCAGTAQAVFAATPTSPSARPYAVKVMFVGQP